MNEDSGVDADILIGGDVPVPRMNDISLRDDGLLKSVTVTGLRRLSTRERETAEERSTASRPRCWAGPQPAS